MDLICNRTMEIESEGVLAAEFTDSAGVTVNMRIALPAREGVEVPTVGTHYDLVPRDSTP